jgi:hypothetical protein
MAEPWTARALWALPRRELWELLLAGHPFPPEELADLEYHGTSLGLPGFVERLTWKKFKKVFCRDGARVRGWNLRLVQRGIDAPPEPQMREGQPATFGHFEVIPAAGVHMPWKADRALLLDYGRGGNSSWDVTSLMRDPLVAVNPGDPTLLLGWSYLDLGAVKLRTPSFFTLERHCPRTHLVVPPNQR